jgi:hypothetical protein
MIWVEASDNVRHNRSLAHLRSGEAPTTLEEFKRQEALQWKPQPGVPIEVQMNLSYVKGHATRTLVNNTDNIDEFLQKSQALIESVTK